MSRPKGSPNKITSEVKDKPKLLIDNLIASLSVNEQTTIILRCFKWPYNTPFPRMKQATDEASEDLPLFDH